ncbi:DUF3349 domain-containing protein [Micropruina sp.]|uniref:DUF3349 domain-containing protein n=1 Tax=Micropruina sp. TaxID=2737536 RepID=UPI0039E2E1C8
MADPNGLFERILQWLRAGYPDGVPQHDYVALLGILRRSLTTAEVEQLAYQLRASNGSTDTDEQIRDLIRRTALEEPSAHDVRRVASRLAQGGWPLDASVAAPTSQEG